MLLLNINHIESIDLIGPHPGLTDIVSTITLLDRRQPHDVMRHLCKASEISLIRSYLLYPSEEDNLWSWETKIDTLDVH